MAYYFNFLFLHSFLLFVNYIILLIPLIVKTSLIALFLIFTPLEMKSVSIYHLET
jgi:putative effector of murein hydrolase LrgA (UPF0299 family)